MVESVTEYIPYLVSGAIVLGLQALGIKVPLPDWSGRRPQPKPQPGPTPTPEPQPGPGGSNLIPPELVAAIVAHVTAEITRLIQSALSKSVKDLETKKE